MKTRELTKCSVLGHNYDPDTGICKDCGDDTVLQDMKRK